MGHIKIINNQPRQQTFPRAQFEIVNEIPITQCKDAVLDITGGALNKTLKTITLVGAFLSYDLTGHIAKVTNPGPAIGEYPILSNDPDTLFIDVVGAGTFGFITGRVKHPDGEYITRNVNSMARYIRANGGTYTIKGGNLYTDMPPPALDGACSIDWFPLT